MYILMLTNTRSLRNTQFEKIYENDNKVSSFRFLIPPRFNGLDMTRFDLMLRYIAPDNQIQLMNIQYENSLYEGMLSIVVPITREFTYKQGILKLQLLFMSKDQGSSNGSNCGCDVYNWSMIEEEIESSPDESGAIIYKDIAFSSAYAYINIERSTTYSSVGIIDRFVQKVNDLEQRNVDNIKVYPETMEMQLQSQGKPIGDKAEIPCRGSSGGENNEWQEIGKYNQLIKENSAEWDEI